MSPEPGQRFRFEETNYEKQKGQIDLGFAAGQAFELTDRREPDGALKALPSVERTDEQTDRREQHPRQRTDHRANLYHAISTLST